MKRNFIIIILTLSSISVLRCAELITLNTNKLSTVLEVDDKGRLLHRYFGNKLVDTSPFLSKMLYRTTEYGTPNEAYSTMGGKNFREPALRITHFDGDLNTELQYNRHERHFDNEKGIEILVLFLRDKKYPLEVKLFYKAYYKENVYVMYTEITNHEEDNVVLHNYYSFYLPIDARQYYLTHFYGIATTEMSVEEIRLTHGMKSIETRKGIRSTHSENPSFLLSLNNPMNENNGEVIAGALAWSNNFKLNFELDEFNTLNISAGINPYAGEYHLATGKSFVTPPMVYTYSSNGSGDASRNLHDWARKDGLYAPTEIRPIVLNS